MLSTEIIENVGIIDIIDNDENVYMPESALPVGQFVFEQEEGQPDTILIIEYKVPADIESNDIAEEKIENALKIENIQAVEEELIIDSIVE